MSKLGFLLVGCVFTGMTLAAGARPLPVPHGNSIIVDGTLSPGEWADSASYPLSGGGGVRLKHDGTHLYVGIRGSQAGWGHVYLMRQEQVHVLHASAAVGTAIYERRDDKAWNAVQDFAWQLADTDPGEEDAALRADYLARHGWVASNMDAGDPKSLEYQIELASLGDDPRLALVHAAAPETVAFWPAGLSAGERSPKLIAGEVPRRVAFSPRSWARLELLEVLSSTGGADGQD